MTTKQPTADQQGALKAFADKHGRNWKSALLDAWLTGQDAREPNGHLLRQVRNQLGPKWLTKFQLDS